MTVMDNGSGPVTWEVLRTQPANGKDEMGVYGAGHQVDARLANGSTFSVFIPNNDVHSVEKVRALIEAKAMAVAAITALRSNPQ